MKSKLTESQHIDICKPINLLNKKWGDKNNTNEKSLENMSSPQCKSLRTRSEYYPVPQRGFSF